MELLNIKYDDGGRAQYFRGQANDCVVRSVAIATGRDYKDVYDLIRKVTGETPRNRVDTRTARFKRMMEGMGFTWTATSGIGSHQAVHFVKGELPEGRLVCAVTGHWVAVVDNEVRDTWDCRFNSFGENRRIYGYWKLN